MFCKEKLCITCKSLYLPTGRYSIYCSTECKPIKHKKQLRLISRENIQEYNKLYNKYKRETDTNFRLKHNLRSRFYNAIKRNSKKGHVLELLNCSIDEFKKHLEIQFDSNMTWENYGIYWEIDHIIPLCKYEYNIENLKILWNFNNLKPLKKVLNRKRKRKSYDLTTIY